MSSDDDLVCVIDDDQAIRKSLAFLLRAAHVEVQTYESASVFLEDLPNIRSGCIITDVRMSGMSGIDLLRRLRQLKTLMPVIVITGHGDVQLAVEAMKEGAVNFLEKPFDNDSLLAAIRSALAERTNNGERQAGRGAIHDKFEVLSTRERQVLEGLVAGHPNKTIAFDLGISHRTVEIYRANVMTKMAATSLSDLVRMAIVGGILDAAPFSGFAKLQ
jgi:two-component system, LuxR family, response regulator FixJ